MNGDEWTWADLAAAAVAIAPILAVGALLAVGGWLYSLAIRGEHR